MDSLDYILLFLAALFILGCYGMKISSFQPDYISIPKTTSVKGFFAVLIFLSHAKGYCELQLANSFGASILNLLGQMVVVMFLFYSGFGIMKQYEHRKELYLTSFIQNRVLKVLIHFDLAVLIYLIVQTALGNRFSIFDYIFCWIGWSSLGNSNWFIFDILMLYLIAYFSLSTKARFSVSKPVSIVIICCFTILLWITLFFLKQEKTWWYDTIIAFPLGAIYAQANNRIDAFHKKFPCLFILIVILCAIIWYMLRRTIGNDPYGLSALLFSFVVVGVSSVISIDNGVLRWLGKNCFQIYILQRLPMIVLEHFGVNEQPLFFFSISFVLTLILAAGFHLTTDRVDRMLMGQVKPSNKHNVIEG